MNNDSIIKRKRYVLIDGGDMTFAIIFKSINVYLNKLKKNNMDTSLVLGDNVDLSTNSEFFEIMKNQYIYAIKKLNHRYATPYKNIIFAKDSPTEQNWRINIYPEYKSHRKNTKYKNKSFNFGNLFKKVYMEILPLIQQTFGIHIIQLNAAEADDIISVITKKFHDDIFVYIISSDTDYLQLLSRPNTFIYGINCQLINEKLGNKNADEKLLYKIMFGDKTDNIPPCIPSSKLIKYYLDNPLYLNQAISLDEELRNRFIMNRKLIDFNCIPVDIQTEILAKCSGIKFN